LSQAFDQASRQRARIAEVASGRAAASISRVTHSGSLSR